MDQRARNKLLRTPQLEDVPAELIHLIQSLLPEKEAARTCILSKSWLHAWSTIPTLRFTLPNKEYIDHTLTRYHNDNIPIETFHLRSKVKDLSVVTFTKKWIRSIASKSSLKELSLVIPVLVNSFTLPSKIFSGENLNVLKVEGIDIMTNALWIGINPALKCVKANYHSIDRRIKCVSLRVLKLKDLSISEHVLRSLLSSCILLEKIEISTCEGFKTITVKKLRCLRELKIHSIDGIEFLEIDDVPNLQMFHYSRSGFSFRQKHFALNTYSLSSVTQLYLSGLNIDHAFLDTIRTKFPLLECLKLETRSCNRSLAIASASLKMLTLKLWVDERINIKVDAPKLQSFTYYGNKTVPTILFPTIVPGQINLTFRLEYSIHESFFLKIREVLNLSSKFCIKIIESDPLGPLDFDIDDLREMVSFPATNVHQLSIITNVWEGTQFFDAFSTICFPRYVKTQRSKTTTNKCFFKLKVKEMMEKKTSYLKDVQLKNPRSGKWEALTTCSWRSIFDTLVDLNSVEFKLNWLE